MSFKKDIQELSHVLRDGRDVLDSIIDNDEFEAADRELAKDLRDTWPEYQARTNDVIKKLDSIPGETDPRAQRLRDAGLLGSMGQMKTKGYRRDRPQKLPGRKQPPWILRKVLKWLNLILGSLGSVIPGAELLKEYKEAVEIGVDNASSPN